MFKWPWKTQSNTDLTDLPWQAGLTQPIFTLLNHDERQSLQAMAQHFLQQKNWFRLKAVSLMRCVPCALLCCSACRC